MFARATDAAAAPVAPATRPRSMSAPAADAAPAPAPPARSVKIRSSPADVVAGGDAPVRTRAGSARWRHPHRDDGSRASPSPAPVGPGADGSRGDGRHGPNRHRAAADDGAAHDDRAAAPARRNRRRRGSPAHPVTFDFQGADLRAVLRTFAEISGLNIVIDPTIQGTVDVALRDVPWDQALDIILAANKLGYTVDGTIVRIAPLTVLADEEASAAS